MYLKEILSENNESIIIEALGTFHLNTIGTNVQLQFLHTHFMFKMLLIFIMYDVQWEKIFSRKICSILGSITVILTVNNLTQNV